MAWRGVGLLCLGWALANPSWSWAVDRLNVLFVWDRSDSIPFTEQLRGWEFMQEAAKSRGRRGTGGGAHPPRPARAAGPPLRPGGHETIGRVLEEVMAAREEGVEIHVLPLGARREGEVLLERMTLPREVKEGEAFILRLVVMSAVEGTGRLTLWRNGESLGAQTVRFVPGKNVFAYRQSLRTTGFHVYQASVGAPGDVVGVNNRALGAVAVGGRPRVLYAEKDREQARPLLRILQNQGIDVDLVGPQEIPRELTPLLRYDTVIVSDVSALPLSRAPMGLLRGYVRDHGGGLIMLGGGGGFGPGGYSSPPVEEALPVTMEARQRIEVPSLAVVLVIDRSGSMDTGAGRFTKLELAKEAAQLVVELLDRRSEVGILAFDTAPAWIVPRSEERRVGKEG